MSLKQARFHVEPIFHFRGDELDPYFGEPHEFEERIVDWVRGCPQPQTYGCYTLWKVLHQQKRIDILEDMVESMRKEMTTLLRRFEPLERQVQGLVELTGAQERSIELMRERNNSLQERFDSQVIATVVEIGCGICTGVCEGKCKEPTKRPFFGVRRSDYPKLTRTPDEFN